jgi:hypothetical protein
LFHTEAEFFTATKRAAAIISGVEAQFNTPGGERHLHDMLGELEPLLVQMRRYTYIRAERAGSRPVGAPVQTTKPSRVKG